MHKIDYIFSNSFCNTYFLINDKNECVIFDPGYDENGKIDKYVEKHSLTLKAIFLTHGHYDHIFSIRKFLNRGIQIYCHEKEVEVICNPRLNLSDSATLKFDESSFIPLIDDEEITISDFIIKIIHTPFHTQGSSCFYIESIDSLISGDTLFRHSIGRSDLPTGSESISKQEESLNKIIHLPANTIIYPGHGQITTLKEELSNNMYLKHII